MPPMNDTAIDIPGISNTNRASKLVDEMGLGKSGRSVVRQSNQSVKEEVLQKPMLAYEKRFGVGSDERHTLQLDELRTEPARVEASDPAPDVVREAPRELPLLRGDLYGLRLAMSACSGLDVALSEVQRALDGVASLVRPLEPLDLLATAAAVIPAFQTTAEVSASLRAQQEALLASLNAAEGD